MHIIKKVLNSSVVLVEDERGIERVLLGKGIGFGAKAGEAVDDSAADRVFVGLDDADHRNFVELLAQIPGEFVELSRAIVADATASGLSVDPHIFLTLTDHLSFAVERHRRGIVVANRLEWELRTVYPVEYEVGARAVALLRSKLGVQIPDSEAANVAYHLANAAVGRAGADTLHVVRLVSAITTIVTNASGVPIGGSDLHTHRFVVHLQFFAERLFSDAMLRSDDDFLFTSMSERFPRSVSTAERVRAYIRNQHGLEIPNEEVAFLAIHIARAATR